MTYPYFNLPNNPFKSYEAFVDGSTNNKSKSNLDKPFANSPDRTPSVLFQEHGQNLDTRAKDSIKQRFEDTELSQLYFSKENIRRIQKAIKKEFYIHTKGQFLLETDQDDNDLIIAMRGVYYTHAKFRPTKLIQQVKQLNMMTVQYILPDMISEAKQEYEYLREINRPLQPLMRPINVHTGKQILPPMTDRLK